MNTESTDTGEVEIEKIPERGTVEVKDGKSTCWHNFEVVFNETWFLRYCKACGKTSVWCPDGVRKQWKSIREESE